MAEYIEREKAIDSLLGWAEQLAETYGKNDEYVLCLQSAAYNIEQIPAADVRPVVRGTWEEDCAGAAVCSVCNNYAFETSTHHLCGWFPNFCPNCGADMRATT